MPCSAVSSYYCRYNELIFRVHLTMLEASAWLLLSMSVCLSVCQMHALWQNEILQVCQYHTIERCCWVLPPLVLWTHHTGIEATALVVPWPPATSALQADDSCTGHYRWRLPTSGRLWLMDTTVFWTLSLYCITLQQHVWLLIVGPHLWNDLHKDLCNTRLLIAPLAKTKWMLLFSCFMRLQCICDSLSFMCHL